MLGRLGRGVGESSFFPFSLLNHTFEIKIMLQSYVLYKVNSIKINLSYCRETMFGIRT